MKYKSEFLKNIGIISLSFIASFFAVLAINVCITYAGQLDINVETDGSPAYITDGSYYTGNDYYGGDAINISADLPISSIYVIWDAPVSEWELSYAPVSTPDALRTLTCGTDGFLHEYVSLPSASYSVTINIKDYSRICCIYAFSGTAEELPDWVQTWQPECDKASIVAFSTHADDEILFLGGVLATYSQESGVSIQVCYMTNYWNGQRVREHEKLDGLWASGITHYPVNGDFDDIYSETLEGALDDYSYSDVLEYVTGQIRRFKPDVVVTQDLNGEYGHGGHMLLAKAVCEAVDNSMDAAFIPEQAALLGTWDVSKTYLHLYDENAVRLELNQPLDGFGGRTALEVASDAYLKHVSQQWCWFYVSDTYQYSCAKFGLYRTTVGVDTVTGYEGGEGANMLEHISISDSKNEAASNPYDDASNQKNEVSDNKSEDLSPETSTPVTSGNSNDSIVNNSRTAAALIVLMAMILLLILMLSLVVMLNHKRNRKKR